MRTLFSAVLVLIALVGCTGAIQAPVLIPSNEVAGAAPASKLLASASGLSGQRGRGLPYEVAGSEVWNVPDPASGRDYQLFVALPPSYSEHPDRRYPVLYVTDADYAFALVRSIGRRLNVEGPKVDEFILVGLSYAVGEEGMTSRRRDYTPTSPDDGASADVVRGEGAAYAAYLRNHVIPFVAARYRSDEGKRLLLGHSYGGLLGTQILFSEPGMFSGYVLGSPSYWYDQNAMERFEQDYARSHEDLDASIYMYVGEYEERTFGKRYNMVSDARGMEKSLKSRNYPSLRVKLDVLNDEDHLSVAPRGFTQGLKYLLSTEVKN